MKKQYITTAIDYPNAAPHMGHVLEKVIADCIARWMRLRGDHVRFQIGTDEHGIKIQRTADAEGISPQELLERNVPLFQSLYDKLHISYDRFIRTSDQRNHWPTVIELWKKMSESGALEKRAYKGLYCSGCERFMTKRDLVDGLCPNHNTAPDTVEEENWFFLLRRESEWLTTLLKDAHGYKIIPDFRAQETLALISQGLEDVSFSRPKTSLTWGVPVPDDTSQTMYVWCDALTNYISGLGYFTDHEENEWWEHAEVMHVIGKDIARFHALYWPAMLKQAGVPVPPPHTLLVHGFLTSDGQKMSKSLGNVVSPDNVINKYGIDPLRLYLIHEIPPGRDGDFSWERMQNLYDSKLRNDIGNLLNRVLTLLKKDGGLLNSTSGSTSFLTFRQQDFMNAMNAYKLSEALQMAIGIAIESNRYIDSQKPWALSPALRKHVLFDLAESLRILALALVPFVPSTAQQIALQLGVPYASQMMSKEFTLQDKMDWGSQKNWQMVGEAKILFPPV